MERRKQRQRRIRKVSRADSDVIGENELNFEISLNSVRGKSKSKKAKNDARAGVEEKEEDAVTGLNFPLDIWILSEFPLSLRNSHLEIDPVSFSRRTSRPCLSPSTHSNQQNPSSLAHFEENVESDLEETHRSTQVT